MRLFNTRTQQVEEFKTLDGSQIAKIYSCGPTVYNHAHIGNMSAYIFADILRRTLQLAGYKTKHAMNFTDVDDKTIRDSVIKYASLSPDKALEKLTRHYENVFRKEMVSVGNDIEALTFIRATESIEGMQQLIISLIEQGIAYIAEDGIYFSIKEYQKSRVYGQLSHVEVADESQSRIDNDEYDKDSARDFALWKRQKPGEPAWDFEIDGENLRGRPGWHIECSTMSVGELGQPFDIHTGGIDLIFPHHENEIAQSTAGDQAELYANFFVHNNHLLVDGTKMAKSKHNFYTLPDIAERGFDPLDFRMLILQSHYRNASNFSWDNLAAAQTRRRNWRNIAEMRWQIPDSKDDGQTEIINNLIEETSRILQDDLDTPKALRVIDQAFDQFSTDNLNHSALDNLLQFIDRSLGLKLVATTPDIADAERNLLAKRNDAKAIKDWAESDKLRAELAAKGITVNDLADKTIWRRS